MKINFGCGVDYREGWVNVDKENVKCDVKHDLNIYPYPFKTVSADRIELNAVLEHMQLNEMIECINECHRILKKFGVLHIEVPHYTGVHCWNNIEHVRGFSYRTLDCFREQPKENSMNDYMRVKKFKIVKARIVFGKKIQIWNYVIEWFVNKFPDVYEQSFISVFPAEGVHYSLTK